MRSVSSSRYLDPGDHRADPAFALELGRCRLYCRMCECVHRIRRYSRRGRVRTLGARPAQCAENIELGTSRIPVPGPGARREPSPGVGSLKRVLGRCGSRKMRMAGVAQTLQHPTSRFAWLGAFLRDELAPYRGRTALVARMVTASTLVMILGMTFQIPSAAYAALFSLLIPRESLQATVHSARILVGSVKRHPRKGTGRILAARR
jgi:hypothetical protein